jgi:hypothetical protein
MMTQEQYDAYLKSRERGEHDDLFGHAEILEELCKMNETLGRIVVQTEATHALVQQLPVAIVTALTKPR